MKVMIDYRGIPFYLAHGGTRTQVEHTMAGLEQAGCAPMAYQWAQPDVRPLPDVIHYFSPPPAGFFPWSRLKGIPSIVTCLFTSSCNRPRSVLWAQALYTRGILSIPGGGILTRHLFWETLRQADRVVVGLEAEAWLLRHVYGLKNHQIAVVPLGTADAFLQAPPASRSEPHLITTGTITERKGSLEIARLAHAAKVPVLFVGKPYAESDPYWIEFKKLIDGKYVLVQGHVEGTAEMAALLGKSRGFVLNSQHENWCFSAHEAAACGIPLLLPDQPWSRERFGNQAVYFSGTDLAAKSGDLKKFHQRCPDLAAPAIRQYSWGDVGQQLKDVYRQARASLD